MSRSHTKWRYVLHHDATSTNYAIVANVHARQHNDASADPNSILNDHGLRGREHVVVINQVVIVVDDEAIMS